MKQHFKIGDRVQVNLKQYDVERKFIYYKFLSGIIKEIYLYKSRKNDVNNYYIYNIDLDNGLNLTIDKNQIIMKI